MTSSTQQATSKARQTTKRATSKARQTTKQATSKAQQTTKQATSKASRPHKAPAQPDSNLITDLATGLTQDLRDLLPDLIKAGAMFLIGAIAKKVIPWLEQSNIPTPPELADLEQVAEQATEVAAEATTALTKQAAAEAADTVVEVTEEAGGIPAVVGKVAASTVAGTLTDETR